jgi:nuclear transport factor 2 (NTF2) superfamily protein
MPDVPPPVEVFISAVNNQDEAGFLGAFTQDGFVDDWGRVFTGRDAIKTWSDREFLGAQGTLTVEEVHAGDDGRITVVGDWRSNHANGRSAFTFDLDGDDVASMTIREA